MSIGERLRCLRSEKGFTQKDVATGMGLTISAYSNYENDLREPSIDIIKKLCAYYQVTADYLLGLED